MRAVAFVALCLLATVSAQTTLTLNAYNSTNCQNTTLASGSPLNVTLGAGYCNSLTITDTPQYAQVFCNNATGVVTVNYFTEDNCTTAATVSTGANSTVVATQAFNNTQCKAIEAFSLVFSGCNIVPAVVVSSSSSSSSSSATTPNNTVVSSSSSSSSSPAVLVSSSSSVSSSSATSPNGTTGASSSTGAPVKSSSTGPSGSAVQTAVSMFALVASFIVALF